MSESRDHTSSPHDIATAFHGQREAVRQIGILPDDEGIRNLFGSPRATREPIGSGRASFGTSKKGIVRGRNKQRSSPVGKENTQVLRSAGRGRGRPRSSALPYWYPRTPLRDITNIIRAIEWRRAKLRNMEGQEIASPSTNDQTAINQISELQLDPESSNPCPNPIAAAPESSPPCTSNRKRECERFLDVTNQTSNEESEFCNPEKMLVKSDYTVENDLAKERREPKNGPKAKKTERGKRVRSLMSMR